MGLIVTCPSLSNLIYSNTPENIFDVHHFVDFHVSHSASTTDIHACIILLLILIHSMQHVTAL